MSAPDSRSTIRRRYVFHGHVQGVFFRATSVDIAQGHPVVGHVRNQPDGTVEMEIEGAAADIAAIVSEIQSRYEGNITRTQQQPLEPRGDERRFEVRY